MRSVLSAMTAACTLVVSLGACSAATQRAYVAPTPQTIFTSTEERSGDVPSHAIYIENHSTVPITVFGLSLHSCENIQQQCEAHQVKIHVGPGQRVLAMRVDAQNVQRPFTYRFGFSWHADSANAALVALASNGVPEARGRLSAEQRADSENRANVGYTELSRDAFRAIAAQATSMRAEPDSLVLEPGQQVDLERVKLLILDGQGRVLGRTHWIRLMVYAPGIAQFTPPNLIVAHSPGRGLLRFGLADEAQSMLANRIADVELPLVVAFRTDPHAPVFVGRAVDADTKTPLACLSVSLEDSAQNVVASDRSALTGAFSLQAPRAGTYRVRIETRGWAPVYGPLQPAAADEEKQQEFLVRFTDQMLAGRDNYSDAFRHAQPAAVRTMAYPPPAGKRGRSAATPIVQGVTLGGSESMPILGIIGRVPPSTTWAQFVVDSTGAVDTTSILLPPDAPANAKASIASVLPRVRFTPALDRGRPVCEMLRMQVNFSPR